MVTNMRFIGIDFGAKGGLASLSESGEILQVTRMPLNRDGSIDAFQVMIWLQEEAWQAQSKGEGIIVTGEKLHSIFGSSAKSNFQFGKNIGVAIGAIGCAQVEYREVRAVDWQESIFSHSWDRYGCLIEVPEMGEVKSGGRYKRDTKAMASFAADALWPTNESKLTDGQIDALLIAEFSRRTYVPAKEE